MLRLVLLGGSYHLEHDDYRRSKRIDGLNIMKYWDFAWMSLTFSLLSGLMSGRMN